MFEALPALDRSSSVASLNPATEDVIRFCATFSGKSVAILFLLACEQSLVKQQVDRFACLETHVPHDAAFAFVVD